MGVRKFKIGGVKMSNHIALQDFVKFASAFTIEWSESVRKLLCRPEAEEYLQIVLFGSATREDCIPNDLDIFVICDHEFIIAAHEAAGHKSPLMKIGLMSYDYPGITVSREPKNFANPMGVEVLKSAGFKAVEELKNWKVDLFFLPYQFFTSYELRKKYSSRQHDAKFYKNAFQNCLAYDDESPNGLCAANFLTIQEDIKDITFSGASDLIDDCFVESYIKRYATLA